MTGESCGDCRFRWEEGGSSTCHRYPPGLTGGPLVIDEETSERLPNEIPLEPWHVIIAGQGSVSRLMADGWPSVATDDWCGEWRMK